MDKFQTENEKPISYNVPRAAAVPVKIEINPNIYSQPKKNLIAELLDEPRHCGLARC